MSLLTRRNINICDFSLAIWVLYYLQGIVYSSGGIVSLGLLAINLLISAVCAIKVIQMNGTPVYFRGLGLLLVMFTIYGFLFILFPPITSGVSGILNKIPSYGYIKGIYLSLLPIYAFYYFARKNYLTAGKLKLWGMIFLISVTLSYFHNQQQALLMAERDETTINAGYLFLSCMPLLVLYRKKPILQYVLLAYVMMFIVLGMKRGAIIIGAAVVLYFFYTSIKNSSGSKRFVFILLSVLLIFGAINFFIYRMSTSDYMLRRIQETLAYNSSGRDNLYSFFWKYFTQDAGLFHYLFGRGANGTLEIYYNYAHNDWLEIAVNQGILGLAIYLVYWINFYRTCRGTRNQDAKTILMMFFAIYFAKTLISMSYGDMSYVGTSVLGYALANRNSPNVV